MNIDTNSVLIQSPFLHLQAAGSDFSDHSSRGVHLRWQLTGVLGENHLPKGNLAATGSQYSTSIGYNRADDFVKLYKATYNTDYLVELAFSKMQPDSVIEEGNVRKWVFKDIPANHLKNVLTNVEVRFIDAAEYDRVCINRSPYQPDRFMELYSGVIEVETDRQLFFKTGIYADAKGSNDLLELEAIAVPDEEQINKKYIACRQRFSFSDPADDGFWITCENMKYIRINCFHANIRSIRLVTYRNTFMGYRNSFFSGSIGQFCLTENDVEAFRRLDNPNENDNKVDGQWPRYNETNRITGAFATSVDNYRDKWSHEDGGIKQAVNEYLRLSKGDPQAIGTVPSTDQNDSSVVEISYLHTLNILATDFHVARMLGLGHIDQQDSGQVNEQHIYCAFYITKAALGQDMPAQICLHVSLSLPTKQSDHRYPPVPELQEVTYGLDFGSNGNGSPINLPNGYTPDGKTRFTNINMKQFPHNEYHETFFANDKLFCMGTQSLPLLYDLKYRINKDLDYRRPEILQDLNYFDPSGMPEVIPIVDQNIGNPLFSHCQTEEGTHRYTLYSINWFSRASQPSNEVSADCTKFDRMPPIPPLNLMAQFIQKENQLIFTTASEQEMLEAIPGPDKSLARVTFEWNQVHNDTYQFADEIEFFMRRRRALVVRGAVTRIEDKPDNMVLVSTGPSDVVQPFLHPTLNDSFCGGVFASGPKMFEIVNVFSSSGNNPSFLLKKNLQRTAVEGEDEQCAMIEEYESPTKDELFSANQNLSQPAQWDDVLDKKVKLEKFFQLELIMSSHAANNRYYTVLNVAKVGANTEITVKNPVANPGAAAPGKIRYKKYIKYSQTLHSQKAILLNESLDGEVAAGDRINLYAAGGNSGSKTISNVSFGNHFTRIELEQRLPDNSAQAGVLIIEKTKTITSLSSGIITIGGQNLIKELIPAHREFYLVDEGTSVHEFIIGGIFDTANVTPILDSDNKPTGAYEVILDNFILTAPLDGDCSWYKGSIRIEEDPGFFPGEHLAFYRKPEIKVLQVYSLFIDEPKTRLIVYDNSFNAQSIMQNPLTDYMPIRTGEHIAVNYHPGYRVYLTQANANHNGNNLFRSDDLLPTQGEGSRQRLIAARSKDTRTGKKSNLTAPVVLLAQEIIIPKPPGIPKGPTFATRPDVYGKSTFTFDMEMDSEGGRQPYAIVCYRADIIKVLTALYKPTTVDQIMTDLKDLETFNPEDAAFFNDRFNDLVNVYYDTNMFKEYVPGGYRFPNPDNHNYIMPNPDPEIVNKPFKEYRSLNDDFSVTLYKKNGVDQKVTLKMHIMVKDAIENAFLSLTEQPILFRYVKDGKMTSPAKPRIRNSNGDIIVPVNPVDFNVFDPFPMAVKYEKDSKTYVRFTDYTLDGAADTCYFYFAVEMNNKMEVSERSPIFGPVSLLNTMPAEPPAIKEIISTPANTLNDNGPQVKIKVNKFINSENIKMIRLYRSTNHADAASVRTMDIAGEYPVTDDCLIDEFIDLTDFPYAEPLYYRVVALREITNEQTEPEYVPSKPSKISLTNIIDVINPPSPEIKYVYDDEASDDNHIKNVALTWKKTVHNGKYYLYKLNNRGNWMKIHEIITNDHDVSIRLEDTLLGSNDLEKDSGSGKAIYHHFKVVAVNSSNLLSRDEKILTI